MQDHAAASGNHNRQKKLGAFKRADDLTTCTVSVPIRIVKAERNRGMSRYESTPSLVSAVLHPPLADMKQTIVKACTSGEAAFLQAASRLGNMYEERQSRLLLAYIFDAWTQDCSLAKAEKRAVGAESKSHDLLAKLRFRGREIAHFLVSKSHTRFLRFRIFIAWRHQVYENTRCRDMVDERCPKDHMTILLSGAFWLWLRSTFESSGCSVLKTSGTQSRLHCNAAKQSTQSTHCQTVCACIDASHRAESPRKADLLTSAIIHEVIVAHSMDKVKGTQYSRCSGMEPQFCLSLSRLFTAWVFVARATILVSRKLQCFVFSCHQTMLVSLAFLMWLHLCALAKQTAVMEAVMSDVDLRLDKLQLVNQQASWTIKYSIEKLIVQQTISAWRDVVRERRSTFSKILARSFYNWLASILAARVEKGDARRHRKHARKLYVLINNATLYQLLAGVFSAWWSKACVASRILERCDTFLRQYVVAQYLHVCFNYWLHRCTMLRCERKVADGLEMRMPQKLDVSREIRRSRREMAKHLAERWLQFLEFQVLLSWQYYTKQAAANAAPELHALQAQVTAAEELLSQYEARSLRERRVQHVVYGKQLRFICLVCARTFLHWFMASRDVKSRLSRRLVAVQSGPQLEQFLCCWQRVGKMEKGIICGRLRLPLRFECTVSSLLRQVVAEWILQVFGSVQDARSQLQHASSNIQHIADRAIELHDRLRLSYVFSQWNRQAVKSHRSYILSNLQLIVVAYKKQASTCTQKPVYRFLRDVMILWRCLVFGDFAQNALP